MGGDPCEFVLPRVARSAMCVNSFGVSINFPPGSGGWSGSGSGSTFERVCRITRYLLLSLMLYLSQFTFQKGIG